MHSKESPHTTQDREHLWNGIKAAPGFPGAFANMWKQRANMSLDAPMHLPKKVPTAEVVDAIFHDFHLEFSQLQKALIKTRCSQAKLTRKQDRNAIYRDVAKPRSLPVSTVVVNSNAIVTDVSVDGLTIQDQSPTLDIEEPVNAQRGSLAIAQHNPGTLTLANPQQIEPGDHFLQPKMLGDLPDIFNAFQNLWEPMWNIVEEKPRQTCPRMAASSGKNPKSKVRKNPHHCSSL